MIPLSAVDAIAPAWRHTSRLLWSQRNWRLLLKLGTCAAIAEMGGCNANFRGGGGHMPSLPPAIHAMMLTLGILIAVIALILFFVFFYLSSRMQFVLFDLVLRSDTTVAPSWRRFGGVTWRWIGLKVLFFMAALACILPMLLPLLIPFFRSLKNAHGNHVNFPSFFLSIIGFIAAIFVFAIIVSSLYLLLRGFGIPSMALEDASMGVTVGRIFRLMRMEPGQVFLYLLMTFLLRLGLAIAIYMVLVLGALVALIPLGGVAAVVWAMLRHADRGGHILMIAAFVVLGLVFAALMIVASLMLFGSMFTFFQAYALYFLGGRYPLVGTILEQGNPPPVYAPPPPPQPWNPSMYPPQPS